MQPSMTYISSSAASDLLSLFERNPSFHDSRVLFRAPLVCLAALTEAHTHTPTLMT